MLRNEGGDSAEAVALLEEADGLLAQRFDVAHARRAPVVRDLVLALLEAGRCDDAEARVDEFRDAAAPGWQALDEALRESCES